MKTKLIVLLVFLSSISFAQVIDGVAGVVGKEMILKSDIETQVLQYKARQIDVEGDLRCYVYEDLLFNTLLINQAAIDSVEVGEQQVEGELTRRLSMFEKQIGDREAMEDYFGKTYDEIKESMRGVVRDQLLAKTMKGQITSSVSVSPVEVEEFYENLPEDSLSLVESVWVIEQIVKTPSIPQEQKDKVIKKLQTYKRDVELGKKDFETLAILYSQDPGSAEKGGDLGWIRRGDLVPEFANAAFKLDGNLEMSDVVESDFGYHLIQFLGRRGEAIHVRHILLQAKAASSVKIKMKKELNDVAKKIRKEEITFEQAVIKYSDDENSKNNGGILLNPYTGNAKFESKHLDPATNYILKSMKIGELSKPFESYDQNGNIQVKIIRLKSKTEAHVASIETDYQRISDMALGKKKEKVISEWIKEKQKTTFIRLGDEYQHCDYRYKGWKE
ncbi:MAG: peptidylprolyl isomerase [Bacteroidota bacterium]|nr:peptidylprolyl isomerase [Bacteroidota bacterium]